MIHTISSDALECRIDSIGAQLLSLKCRENGIEYIWTGDSNIWKWHAPVLFPWCGNFPNGYESDGAILHLPQHGFLRNMEHEAIEEGYFIFENNGIKNYPFALCATTKFRLDGNVLIHSIEIRNKGNKPMPCSLGFHTGFSMDTPTLEFEVSEEEIGGKFFIADDSTMEKTILLTKIRSNTIVCSDKNGKRLRWGSSGFTTLVLWTMPGHSRDFICIEPRIDTIPEGSTQPFKMVLEPGETTGLSEKIEIL